MSLWYTQIDGAYVELAPSMNFIYFINAFKTVSQQKKNFQTSNESLGRVYAPLEQNNTVLGY